MADDWDDWGDDDNEEAAADGGDNNSSGDKSEGWDWPVAATTKPPAATTAEQQSPQRHEDESSAVEREAREAAVDEMTEKFFVELRSYLENLADPSVREEINQVSCTRLMFRRLEEVAVCWYEQQVAVQRASCRRPRESTNIFVGSFACYRVVLLQLQV